MSTQKPLYKRTPGASKNQALVSLSFTIPCSPIAWGTLYFLEYVM